MTKIIVLVAASLPLFVRAETLLVSGTIIDQRKFGVVESIQAQSAISEGANVTLEAVNNIKLTAGFISRSGSTFTARTRNISSTTTYSLTEIVPVNGSNVRAYAVNNAPTGSTACKVVGTYRDTYEQVDRGFVWTNGSNLFSPRGQSDPSVCYGINDANVLVGHNNQGSTRWAGPDGTYQELHLPGAAVGQDQSDEAYAVNGNDLVAGRTFVATNSSVAVLWEKINVVGPVYNPRDLNVTNPAGQNAGLTLKQARDVNNSNVVVGTGVNSVGQLRAFRSIFASPYNTQVMDLGAFPGGTQSEAMAVNASGVVTGYAYYTGTTYQAFTHTTSGGLVKLGAVDALFSIGYDINSSNIVVGVSGFIQTNGSEVSRAARFSSGEVWDLNVLIPQSQGWVLQSAWSINDAGYIVAQGTHNGVAASCLLVPSAGGQIAARSVASKLNEPPIIQSAPWADPNPVHLPATTTVNVIASDPDNGPSPLTYTWSKVSGTGDVVFTPNGSVDALSSIASFTAAGIYTLRVTVSDGLDTATGDVIVTVLKEQQKK